MSQARPNAHLIRQAARPLTGAPGDYDALLELVGDARFVLLGEASHGTHDFYRARAEITKRLVREKGFTAVAVEADWPDACRVNRYVRGAGGDADAEEALAGFRRFPQWMWRNLGEPLLERAIGVIYLPVTERVSHYFDARVSEQFDAVLHFDVTRAVEPLERAPEWNVEEPAETYPTWL